MRAELTISHGEGSLLQEIVSILGPHEPAALAESSFFQKAPEAAKRLQYAKRGVSSILLAWAVPGRLYLYVESSGGRLRAEADKTWDLIRSSDSSLEPHLQALVLLDEDANDEIATAGVAFEDHLKRKEIAAALITGVVTVVWLAVALLAFDSPGDLVLGAIPPLVAALLASTTLAVDWRRQRLVWQ